MNIPNMLTHKSVEKAPVKEASKAKDEGIKLDADKTRYDLVDLDFIEQFADVLTFGAKKYGPNSWKKVEDGKNRYFSALIRHIIAFRKGEKNDPETGKSHLAHAVCNLMFMFGFDKMEDK